MSHTHRPPPATSEAADWDPRAPEVLADQRAAYDAMMSRYRP